MFGGLGKKDKWVVWATYPCTVCGEGEIFIVHYFVKVIQVVFRVEGSTVCLTQVEGVEGLGQANGWAFARKPTLYFTTIQDRVVIAGVEDTLMRNPREPTSE